jgi:serine/threonine protein phosphatase PrpC
LAYDTFADSIYHPYLDFLAMKNTYEVLGYSVSNIGKEKNGDHFLHSFLDEEDILIAIVADGVSKQPCDWFASETTCQKVYEFFQSLRAEQEIATRLLKSIQQANEFILRLEGPCRKMASTLSVIVWPTNAETYWLANVGDSRIYSLYEGQLGLLTKDDVILFKERVLTHGGVRVIDRPMLNKVMGMPNLNVSVKEQPFRESEILILASDGFYDARKSIFSQTMAALSKLEDFQGAFEETVKKFEMLRGDDFTTVMIRNIAK